MPPLRRPTTCPALSLFGPGGPDSLSDSDGVGRSCVRCVKRVSSLGARRRIGDGEGRDIVASSLRSASKGARDGVAPLWAGGRWHRTVRRVAGVTRWRRPSLNRRGDDRAEMVTAAVRCVMVAGLVGTPVRVFVPPAQGP
ncbi:hypothetical protein SAVCW2_00030 [Streptomyces avermitilis]|nr:hypothetical protein SAVCW2_00030 [Streptomyces avermitilis]